MQSSAIPRLEERRIVRVVLLLDKDRLIYHQKVLGEMVHFVRQKEKIIFQYLNNLKKLNLM